MKIGIISDTHDDHGNVLAAIGIFNDAGVDTVLHAGDIISPFTARAFETLKSEHFIAVFGNNEGEKGAVRANIESFGGEIHDDAHGWWVLVRFGSTIIVRSARALAQSIRPYIPASSVWPGIPGRQPALDQGCPPGLVGSPPMSGARLNAAFYAAPVSEFLAASNAEAYAPLAAPKGYTLAPEQLSAWHLQLPVLRAALADLPVEVDAAAPAPVPPAILC